MSETTVFGEVNWEDNSNRKSGNSKDDFLHLDEGDNELRLVTLPYQYCVHMYKKEDEKLDKKKFGHKVFCSLKDCPLCKVNDKSKMRWYLGVISRKHQAYRILDISYAIYGQIQKLAKNKKWGDPQKYDLNIIVDKTGGATGYYTVQPQSKEPLSAEDMKMKENADLEELKRRVTPPTSEQVQKRIDKINGTDTATTPVIVVESESDTSSDDETPDFPNYDTH